MTSGSVGQQQDTKAWHTMFPAPKSSPPFVSHDVLREMIEESAGDEDTGFVIVDVRRVDFEDACIKSAVNIPAQSFFHGIPTWSKVFGDRTVIFHCVSSNGRGPRCAAWYQDYLDAHKDLPGEAAILEGGIKEWLKHYKGNDQLVIDLPNLDQ